MASLHKVKTEELNSKINEAKATLDRNIVFVSNCDSKTSIVLSATGVLLTIILTNNGIETIFNIIKSCISQKNFCNIMFLFFFAISIVLLVIGFYNLCMVLIARTKNASAFKSQIFFSGIANFKDKNTFLQKFASMTPEEYLDELVTEIYANAKIAVIKYKKYNTGFKFTIIGFTLFAVILLMGIYLYL